MDTLTASPLFIPYCILMLVAWEENYCNYIEQKLNDIPLLYWQPWYKGAIILCTVIGIITLFILCFSTTWWLLAFTLLSGVTWLPLLAVFITRTLGVVIARPVVATVEILTAIYLVINWF